MAAVLAGGVLAAAAVVQVRGVPEVFAFTRLSSSLLDPHSAPGRGTLLAVTVLLVTAGTLWMWASSRSRPWPGIVLLGIVVGELFALGIGFNSSFPSSMTFPTERSLAALAELTRAEPQPVRVVNVPTGEIVPGQIPMVWDLQVPTGYTSWLLRRYAAYTRLIPGETGGEIEVYFTDCAHPLLDALNPGFVYAPATYALQGAGAVRLDQRLGSARVSSHFAGGVSPSKWSVNGEERPVIFASGPTTITFRVLVPAGGRLLTAVGLSPDSWSHSDGMTFQVTVGRGDVQSAKTRFLEHLAPPTGLEDRSFLPVEVDLSDLAGHVVDLTLVTGPGPAHDLNCDWGAWVEPVVMGSGEPALELLHDGPNRIYRNRDALPRAWMVRRAIEVELGNLDLVGRCLASPTFEPAVEAVVEGRVEVRLGVPQAGDAARVLSYAPERVELEVETAEPALLVMSDMVYPGWRATVDGVERPILPTNMIMRGVVVMGGTHRVVFEYRPRFRAAGLAISALALGGCAVAWIGAIRRRGGNPHASAAS